MDNASNLANSAFESFLNHDFKTALNTLNKIKNNKEQSEKFGHRLIHNVMLAEMFNNKMSNLANYIAKMEDIIPELKAKSASKGKDSRKVSSTSDDDNAEKTNADVEDDTFFRYNYGVALNITAKKQKSMETLKELFSNKDMISDYLTIKTCLLYIDMAISNKDYQSVKTIVDFLDHVKRYVPSVRDSNPNMDADEANKELHKSEGDDTHQEKTEPPPKSYFNPIIFGTEVYKHGENPSNFCKTEFHLIYNIYQTYLLISLKEFDLAKKKIKQCKALYNEFVKIIKENVNEKGEQIVGYSPTIAPYITKHMHFLFSFSKASLAYATQQYKKCIRLLNYLESPIYSGEEVITYNCYQLNNIACCHMKFKKYNLAAYYLTKAINQLQKINKDNTKDTGPFNKNETLLNFNGLQQYPYILYNYALCLLQIGKYEEASEAFSALAQYWPDNVKIWYRAALCHLNKYHQILSENHNQKKNNIYSSLLDLPNYTLMSEEERADSKPKKTEDIEHKETIYYTRYVLNSKDNSYYPSEEDLSTSNTTKFINQNPDLNKGNEGPSPSLTEKQLRIQLDKAHKCFRNAVMIAKRKRNKFQKEQPIQISMKSIDISEKGEDSKESEVSEESKKNDITLKAGTPLKEHQDILQSSLVYLAYTSLCLGETNNAMNFAKEALELPFLTEENKYLALMYLVEACCIVGDQKEALNQMNSANVNQLLITSARNVLGINHTHIMDKLSSKIVIYTNLATVHILNNNFTGAQNALNIVLNNLDPNSLQVPIPILNLLVYLNLRIDKPEIALQLLKRRKVISAANNKLLLRIVK